MPHRFDQTQHIDPQGRLTRATGEVNGGEQMFWIAAFIFQNDGGHHAAAWGDKQWGGGKADHWACQTTMAPGSQLFKEGKARAWGLARVSDGGGAFFGWGHEVDLVKLGP
jgi:hypothetical protein